MRKTLSFCAGMALAWAAVVSAAQRELLDGIAAVVNEDIITFQEVDVYTAQAVDLIDRTYGRQREVFNQKRREALTTGLEDLIEKQLILDDFKAAGGKLPDSIIDDEIKDRIRRQFGDRVTLTKTLQAQGVTYETFRRRTHDDIIVRYMRERNIRAAILISPQKIETYYATNQHRYKLDDQIKLRVIVLNRPSGRPPEEVRRLAAEILLKINEGASFAEMATIHSQGSQGREGGDWGWFEESKLNRGLADVAFQLKSGQHSSVLALARDAEAYWLYQYSPAGHLAIARKYTDRDVFLEERRFEDAAPAALTLPEPNDFYLMKVEDKRAARVKSLSEVQEEIEKELILRERSRLQRKWIDRLKQKAFILQF